MANALALLLNEGLLDLMLSGADKIQLYRCGCKKICQIILNSKSLYFYEHHVVKLPMDETLCRILFLFPKAKSLRIETCYPAEEAYYTWSKSAKKSRDVCTKYVLSKRSQLKSLVLSLTPEGTQSVCNALHFWLQNATDSNDCLFPKLAVLELGICDNVCTKDFGGFWARSGTTLDFAPNGTLLKHFPKLVHLQSAFYNQCNIAYCAQNDDFRHLRSASLSVSCQDGWCALVANTPHLTYLRLRILADITIQNYPANLVHFMLEPGLAQCTFDCELPRQLKSFVVRWWNHTVTSDWFLISKLPRGLERLSLNKDHYSFWQPPKVFELVEWETRWPSMLEIDLQDERHNVLEDLRDSIMEASTLHPNVAYTMANYITYRLERDENLLLSLQEGKDLDQILPFLSLDDESILLAATRGMIQSPTVNNCVVLSVAYTLAKLGKGLVHNGQHASFSDCARAAIRHYAQDIAPFISSKRDTYRHSVCISKLNDWVAILFCEFGDFLWPKITNNIAISAQNDSAKSPEGLSLRRIATTGFANLSSVTLSFKAFDDKLFHWISLLPFTTTALFLKGEAKNLGPQRHVELLQKIPIHCVLLQVQSTGSISYGYAPGLSDDLSRMAFALQQTRLKEYRLFINHSKLQYLALVAGYKSPNLKMITIAEYADVRVDVPLTTAIYSVGRVWPANLWIAILGCSFAVFIFCHVFCGASWIPSAVVAIFTTISIWFHA